MKLEYFFFGLFALLLAATGMLAMHYRGELMYERRLSELARQAPAIPQAPAAPAPAPAPAAPAADPAAAERAALARQLEQAETEKNLLSSQVRQMQETQKTDAPPSPETPDLTATQLKIKETPAIARIQRYLPDQGFAVLDAGTARGLKPGQTYAVRRGHFIVANQIEIGETVEENESIAGVNASSLQPGETLKPGDEVIKWDQPSAPQ